jgi:putative nucleotidyltransferase-like protein
MADHSFDTIEATLKRTVAALREAGLPFLLGGSLASWARGGPETRKDLDFMVKPEDAERALDVLAETGMRPERPPEEWLFKAWDGELCVDVIFEPRGVRIDDEAIARGEDLHVLGITIPVLAVEDLMTTKLMSIGEHSVDYSGVLLIARALREQIDWPALRRGTEDSPYARAFFVLAEGLGLASREDAAPRADVRVLGPA